MTVQGPRKGEPSLSSMRNGLRPQPARLVRGSSRRIMSMRFRPANIRVINRRASSSAVICSAVQTVALQAHQQERVPATPPVASLKLPERCSPARVRFAAARPSGNFSDATGGSGGNTSRSTGTENGKTGSLRNERKPVSSSELSCQLPVEIDRSLHISRDAIHVEKRQQNIGRMQFFLRITGPSPRRRNGCGKMVSS